MVAKDLLEVLKGKAQAKVDEAQAEVDALVELGVVMEAELQAKFQEGKDSVILPEPGTGELLFTQDDMDALALQAKKEVTDVLQPQIDQKVVELEAAVARVEKVKAGATQAILDLKVKDDVLADDAVALVSVL